MVDIEAYEAARGHGTPIKQEIDSEETTEAKIRRWQIAWSSVPDYLVPMVERYMQLAVYWPKEFVRLFAAAFLTPPKGGSRGCSNDAARSDRALSYEEQSNATTGQSRGDQSSYKN